MSDTAPDTAVALANITAEREEAFELVHDVIDEIMQDETVSIQNRVKSSIEMCERVGIPDEQMDVLYEIAKRPLLFKLQFVNNAARRNAIASMVATDREASEAAALPTLFTNQPTTSTPADASAESHGLPVALAFTGPLVVGAPIVIPIKKLPPTSVPPHIAVPVTAEEEEDDDDEDAESMSDAEVAAYTTAVASLSTAPIATAPEAAKPKTAAAASSKPAAAASKSKVAPVAVKRAAPSQPIAAAAKKQRRTQRTTASAEQYAIAEAIARGAYPNADNRDKRMRPVVTKLLCGDKDFLSPHLPAVDSSFAENFFALLGDNSAHEWLRTIPDGPRFAPQGDSGHCACALEHFRLLGKDKLTEIIAVVLAN